MAAAEPTVRFRNWRGDEGGDERGLGVSLASQVDAFLGRVQDTHVTTIRPGFTRGNHYHKARREILIVMYREPWTLAWQDGGPGGPSREHRFDGVGVALVELEPPCPHALRNDGKQDLWVVAHCDGAYDPADPDSQPHSLI